MKKIFAALLALVSSAAFSATLNPIQLLNPAGSTAGQFIVSTGPTTAPAWGNISGSYAQLGVANTWTAAQTFSAAIIPSQTAGIVGTTTNNNANAGSVGEYSSTSTLATALTSLTPVNSTSAVLAAGDWDVECVGRFNVTSASTLVAVSVGVSTTSATIGAFGTFSTTSNGNAESAD